MYIGMAYEVTCTIIKFDVSVYSVICGDQNDCLTHWLFGDVAVTLKV